MPVEMVLSQVQYCGGTRLKGIHLIELKTGQLQHPGLWPLVLFKVHSSRQGVEQGGANVPCYCYTLASTF